MTQTDAKKTADLSERMERAGFRLSNSSTQAAAASAIQDVGTFLFKDAFLPYTFGSASDGWGSCLTKLDGTIDDDSDIDITLIPEKPVIHLCNDPKCQFKDTPAKYDNGHVDFQCIGFFQSPTFKVEQTEMLPNIDLIIAWRCCSYPPIELLQAGYKNRLGQSTNISPVIMEQLTAEVVGESPRCHAVATGPPDLPPESRMRVSTTLLERTVMHNLTTVQGQFFIFIKFLIKKVINKKVEGLKTYMAKNLLFYMLDETPAEDWKPENLLELVRQSLQMLVEMMESSDSDDVCMKHFFLRDANVYFKREHGSKSNVVNVIKDIIFNFSENVEKFSRSLADENVKYVRFDAFLFLIFIAESNQAATDETANKMYNAVASAKTAINDWTELEALLAKVSSIPPDCKFSKDYLRAQVYQRAGKPVDEFKHELAFSISLGIDCTSDDLADEISLQKTKEIVLKNLREVEPLDLEVNNEGRITRCALEKQAGKVADFFANVKEGNLPSPEQMRSVVYALSPRVPLLLDFEGPGNIRALKELEKFWKLIDAFR